MIKRLFFPFAFAAMVVSCSTSGHFIIPEGTQLRIHERDVAVGPNGRVEMKPMFWTAAGIAPHGGAKYELVKDGKIVKSGRLRVVFRTVSIFWPPFATIYWPIGLNPDITYDLVQDRQM